MRHEFTYARQRVILTLDNPHIENSMGGDQWFYEQKMLEYISDHFSGGVFVDAGAYYGGHSIYFALFCAARAVFAFEPVYHRQLEQNLADNNLGSRVAVYQYGLGKTERKMGWRDRSAGQNSGATSLIEGGDAVEIRTLDSLDLNPTVIKIDVENMEKEVIEGAWETINRNKPALFVELVENYKEVSQLLTSIGYKEKARFNATPTYLFIYEGKES